MKVTFIHSVLESIGVEYLSASLKQNGHSVTLVFDPCIGETFRFHNRFLSHFFSCEDLVIEKAINSNPDLVCFSVYTDNYLWACRIACALRERTNVPILFGGIHATLVPEKIIVKHFIDYVCVSEGDLAIAKLVEGLSKKRLNLDGHLDNIWIRKGAKIIPPKNIRFVENLDTLPFPDKHLFFKEYPEFIRSIYTIITSRNCIFKCSYCHNSYLDKFYINDRYRRRRRSIGNVISELVWAKNQFGIKRVAFFDDLFVSHKEWLKDFLKEYKKEIGLPFFCTVHTSFINREVVELLDDCGCSSANLGVQTVSEAIRKNVLRRYDTNKEIVCAMDLFKKTKIFLFTNVIFGLPYQDEKEMSDMISFFNKSRPDFADSNWLRYYPKTAIVDFALKESLLSQDNIITINEGNEFRPYSLGGHTRNQFNSRLRNLLSIINFLPQGVVRKIIKHKLYNYLPVFDLRHISVLCNIFIKKYLGNKKNPYPHLSFADMLRFYFYYTRIILARKCSNKN